jgi:hypothetical protein
VELPRVYSILSRTQRRRPWFDKSWGGVAAVFRSALKLIYRHDFSGPDSMVLQLNRLLIYLMPESSQ